MMKAPYLYVRHHKSEIKHYTTVCGEIFLFELERRTSELKIIEGGSGFQPR
jgi:hypothetical protein